MSELSNAQAPAGGWRLKLGIGIFALSILLPILGVPLVAAIGLPAATTATVSGALLVCAEILGVTAVAVMGKKGYLYLKNHIFGFLKRYGPPQKVSRKRYKIGLILFVLPLLLGWLSPYLSVWRPELFGNPLSYAVPGDLMLVVGLFVLGGDFWDKIRSLFIHNAVVNFGQELAAEQCKKV